MNNYQKQHDDVDVVVSKYLSSDSETLDTISILASDSTSNQTKEIPKSSINVSHNIYHLIYDYIDTKYNYNTKLIEEKKQDEIDLIFREGIKSVSDDLSKTSSSTSLLFNGRSPRVDVMKKLATIAFGFRSQEMYPNFSPIAIMEIIRGVVGHCDDRTEKKYLHCVLDHSAKNGSNGTYNVDIFYTLVPKQKILEVKQSIG